jgi:hypothetical protein
MEGVDIEKLIEEELPPDAPEWVKRIIRLNQAVLERHMEDSKRLERFLSTQVGEVEDLVKVVENFVGRANEQLASFEKRIAALEKEED